MWNPENTITEADASIAGKNRAVKSLRLVKEGDDYYILLYLSWRKEELFLATMRSQKEPRRFKHIGRLIEYIETHFPAIESLTLELQAD